MADGSGEEERKRKWRKKRYGRRKLLPGEDVEVLCCDEGLKGSWHAGTVIGCGGCSRLIEYRDLLNEDECSKLKETIPVSAAIEGQARRNPKNYRGLIRPLPPCYDVQIFEMRYGLCVDALVDDAWWEGVVFDHEEGSTNRMIFFPDQGDKQMVPVDHLRLTQDWNETSGRWKPRGKWLLLQVLQAFEEEDALPVSIREFWYDLSTMASFTEKIGHWMFGSQSGWESLASGLIRELLSVVHGLSVVSYVQSVDVPVTFGNDIPMDDVPYWKGSHIPSDTADDCFVEGSGSSSKSIHAKKSCSLEASGVEVYGKKTLISTTQDVQNQNSGIPLTYVTLEEVSTQDLHTKRRHRNIHQKANSHVQTVGHQFKKSNFESINEVSPDRKHCRDLIKALEACNDIEFQSMKSDGTNNNLHCDGLFNEATNIFSHGNNTVADARTRRSRTSWQSLYVDAELCPEAIALYAFRSADSNSQLKPTEIAEKVKKHLFALGWKIECRRDRFLRVRCLSPEGKHYYTLRNACIDLLKGRLNDDQSYRKGCNSIGNCSTFSKFDSNTANIYQEPAFLMQNLPVCSSIKRTEGTSDRFSHPFGLFETNIDTRTKKIPEEECRSFCKLADDSHDLLDSGITKLSVAEFHEGEQQSNTSVPGKENAKLNVSEDFPTFKNIEPEYLPEAIITYKRYIESSREKGNEKLPKLDIELMKLNAQKHLLYMGWRFAERRRKLRFASPGGEVFHSLYTACEAYLDKEENQRKTNESSLRGTNGSQNSWCLSTDDKFKYFNETSLLHTNNSFSTSMASDEFQESDEISNDGAENRAIIISYSSECGEGFSNLHLRNFTSSKIGIRNSSLLPMKATECRMLKHHSGCSQKSKKRKVQDPSSKGDEPSNIFLLPEQKLSERCQQIAVTSPTQKFTKATLSILIDNHIVSARQKVRYICKRNGHVMMEGHITRNGIKCKCCRKLHSLTGFEAHAGSNKRDPGANTFLLDGRSLLQCQLQMVYGKNPMDFPHPRLKHVYAHSQSDSICSVCQYGGTLILCDHCPSAFHVHCVGLKDVPKGTWFCPSCQCGICGSSAFNSAEEFTEKTMLYCHQCECKYHVGCLRERGMSFKCFPTGNWFCSKNCSKIFLHLRNLLGKSNPTTTEGLSWTIVRSMRETDADFKKLDFKTVPRHCSKLHVAHKLLHECFVTMIEPRTQSDLLADLLMNRESELNRLNFWGFYTMLLESGDKIISVATFRVYGEKIAEVPLVGTRAKYRRQGMCHIILDELEKLLSALGVERLCIPAVPTLIETWTSSFGFTKMSSYERLNLLEYTLLNFQGTIMCQKLLRAAPEVTNNPKGKYEPLTDSCSKNLEIIDSEASGLVSEVAEVVKILNSSPSLGIQACFFPGQIDTSKKISHQTHHSHSPASSSCEDPILHTTKCDIIE